MDGYQICIEGPDNVGKSTMAKKLVDWLKQQNKDVIYTRHPGATPLGKELRRIIENSELSVDGYIRGLLFATDNAAYISTILRPTLQKGTWIVSDRNNFISSLAYQIADGVALEQLDKIHTATYPADLIPKIDLLIILRASYEVAYLRRENSKSAASKEETYEKKMGTRDFFDRVSNAYSSLMEDQISRLEKFVHTISDDIDPDKTPRCLYINAARSEDAVFNDIIQAVKILM